MEVELIIDNYPPALDIYIYIHSFIHFRLTSFFSPFCRGWTVYETLIMKALREIKAKNHDIFKNIADDAHELQTIEFEEEDEEEEDYYEEAEEAEEDDDEVVE